jgi:hypothetical protein
VGSYTFQWPKAGACRYRLHCSRWRKWSAPCSAPCLSYLLARELSAWKTITISYIVFRHLLQTNLNLQYLHPIEKSSFIHIIDVLPRILI